MKNVLGKLRVKFSGGKMKKVIFGVLVGLLSSNVMSGTVSGTIENLLVGRSGNEMYIKLSGVHYDSPCSDSHPSGYQIAIDLDDTRDAIVSTVMLAFAASKTVSIQGAGSCASFDSRLERFGYIAINK